MARKYTKTVDKLPKQFVTSILARKMPVEALKELAETYAEARQKRVLIEQPSSKAVRLASLAKESGYMGAAKKAGVDVGVVYAAVNHVSRYNWFNGALAK